MLGHEIDFVNLRTDGDRAPTSGINHIETSSHEIKHGETSNFENISGYEISRFENVNPGSHKIKQIETSSHQTKFNLRANPDKSKHLETATASVLGHEIDFVNLRTEIYNEHSRNPQVVLIL